MIKPGPTKHLLHARKKKDQKVIGDFLYDLYPLMSLPDDGLGQPIANWAKDAGDCLKDGEVSRRSMEKGMADGASSSGP